MEDSPGSGGPGFGPGQGPGGASACRPVAFPPGQPELAPGGEAQPQLGNLERQGLQFVQQTGENPSAQAQAGGQAGEVMRPGQEGAGLLGEFRQPFRQAGTMFGQA